MKKIILFFFFSIYVYAQESNIVIEYEYKLPIPNNQTKAFLFSTKQANYFFLSKHDKGDLSYEDVYNNNSLLNPYFNYKFDKVEQVFYHRLPFLPEEFKKNISEKLINDKIPIIKWTILSDSKKILDYNCTKAIADFRGRRWVVWFTTDIQGDAFPWKLNGLPGAILQADETNSHYGMKVVRIINNGNFQMIKKYIDLFDSNSKNSLDYRKIIELQNNYLRERKEKEIASYPAGTIFGEPVHYREGELEKNFEWEEDIEK